MGRPATDLYLLTFGDLIVVARFGSVTNRSKGAAWLCLCSCGALKIAAATSLLRGMALSCGCQQRARWVETMRGRFVREANPNWRGGRSIASNGYVIVRVGRDHRLADVRGYAYEHRLVADRDLRELEPDDVVHHQNEIKVDNAVDNLRIMTEADHARLHLAMR